VLHDQGGWGGLLIGIGFKASPLGASVRLDKDAPEGANTTLRLPALLVAETVETTVRPGSKPPAAWRVVQGIPWDPALLPEGARVPIDITKRDDALRVLLGRTTVVATKTPPCSGAVGGVSFYPSTTGLLLHEVELTGTLDPPWLRERAAERAKAESATHVPPP
jgi:hypothetical protein